MNYFTLEELTRSAVAAKNGIDNTPPTPEIRQNMQRLIDTVLNPARNLVGSPVYVNSGYRCPELNRRVGGVSNSYHLKGRAADLDTRTGQNRRLFEILRRLPHTELLWENGGAWIHVALVNCKRVLHENSALSADVKKMLQTR